MKKKSKRTYIQLLSAAFFNGYAAGFTKGEIFQGNTKGFCIPVLNCYSCPGALGGCPIGSLQAVSSTAGFRFSFYCLGLMAVFGLVLGRVVCGFLCPFGLLQDLLHRLPVKKVKVPKKLDKALRYFKYAVLLFLVLLLPALVLNDYGYGETWFCKYLCPVGTLEAGLPLLWKNASLRASLSWLFGWKSCLLLIFLIASTLIHRPFCRYVCPLGAFYGLFHQVGLHQMRLDKEKCIGCGKCEAVCPMGVACQTKIKSAECIHCGECQKVCPTKAIVSSFTLQQ